MLQLLVQALPLTVTVASNLGLKDTGKIKIEKAEMIAVREAGAQRGAV
jgi:hypothetical protein